MAEQSCINLLDLSIGQLKDFFVSLGEKPFRAAQILKWIYQWGVTDFASMHNINKDLRVRLNNVAQIKAPEILTEQRSTDGTIKWAFDAGSHQAVESVLIPEEGRNTLCISTQVGCPIKCAFCRTGYQGFSRNLTLSEIIGQVFAVSKRVGFRRNGGDRAVTNVVMMGMGEPLLNIKNVKAAVEILLDDNAFGLSKRRVTISTSGVVPVLDDIAGRIDVALALSLHAADDELRNKLVPLNRAHNIKSVLESVKNYIQKSNANCGRVTIEYVLLDHVNDDMKDAEALSKLLKDVPCKINLIPFNAHDAASGFKRPSNSRIDRFSKVLMGHGYTVITRSERGGDILAACGQLAGQVNSKSRVNTQVRLIP